jgi:hypothetical protein
MRSLRRFPFGKAPAPMLTQSTAPLPLRPPPPDPKATAPLADFMPPERVLPFRAPPPPALPASLVPPLPPHPARRSRVSYQNVAAVILIVLDLVVFAYVAATWGR